MKKSFVYSALVLSGLVAAPAMAFECSDLAELKLHNVNISSAKMQDAQTLPPDPMSAMTGSSPQAVDVGAHCLVEGKIEDREGVAGRYGINFQMRLPQDWNGKFLFQGGGGVDGFIAPAIGTIPSTGSTATPAIKRGYAVVSMDGGHNGRSLDFAEDQQARLDLGYASIGKVTNTAKTILRNYYDESPKESYFMGCSNGGREAMMAAQRFPLEFDGIVAGNPGFRLSHAALGSTWDVKQLEKIAPNGELSKALSQSDLDKVSDEILKQCDAIDGVKDGVVAAYSACDFDPETLRGKIDDAKLDTLTKIMNGALDENGDRMYTGWPWDPGINADGWRAWKLGSDKRPAMHKTLSVPATGHVFMTPPQEVAAQPDFAAMAENVNAVGGYFDADDTFLSTFAKRGGKMVIFQGVADPIFSAKDIALWYQQTQKDTGTDFAKLYMVPGMTHCGGGPAFEDFDPLTVLENWNEKGQEPEFMPATAPTMPGREMPLCNYPSYAKYEGGDKNAIESYSCVAPESAK